ncbi:ATP-binding cassette domain-containing protein [Candidatus Peregrinibacteria bacterium]|nr:ATP-binding cassette domain-containing protein [Candidatus Peregrinibacteria bacterium]
MIAIDHVSKKYGKVKVLDDINIKIEPGEFVSFIGPSGAGKSTLIYSLIGAEPISRGRILVDGIEVNKLGGRSLQFYRRKLGVIFQDYKLLKQKNVYENVAFALEVCGFEKSDIKERVHEVLGVVGLGRKQKQFPHQLSGGEKQRVAIARALAHYPSVIIADEPTGNLDPKTGQGIVDLLLKINENGTTVILTTHNKDIINRLKKRVISIEEGKLVSDKKSAGYHT